MMKVVNLNERAFSKTESIEKTDFEPVVMFLSGYNKSKEVNSRRQSLFTIINETNPEEYYKGVLQYYEQLNGFVEYETEITNFDLYYKYFSIKKHEKARLFYRFSTISPFRLQRIFIICIISKRNIFFLKKKIYSCCAGLYKLI